MNQDQRDKLATLVEDVLGSEAAAHCMDGLAMSRALYGDDYEWNAGELLRLYVTNIEASRRCIAQLEFGCDLLNKQAQVEGSSYFVQVMKELADALMAAHFESGEV